MKTQYVLVQLLLLMLFTTCQVPDDFVPLHENREVRFSSTFSNSAVSRGLPVSSSNSLSEFIVYGYYTGNGTTNNWSSKGDTSEPNFMYEQVVTNSGYNTGTDNWGYSPVMYWPSAMDANVTFFAYTPQASSDNGLSVAETTGGLTITYTAPTSCSDQPDLMISVPVVDAAYTEDAIAINMKHALACIGFKVKGSEDYIVAINMQNIVASGTMTYDIASDSIIWTLDDTSSLTYNPLMNDSALNSNYQSVITADGYLMLPPQTTGDNASIDIKTYTGLSKGYNISGQVWKAGDKIEYYADLTSDLSDITINIIENGFVSAYWRYNETGERIIRMYNDGDWRATLYAVGDGWDTSDIFLDYLPSSYNSTPGSLIYSSIAQLTSTETELTGTGNIAFRIGLASDATLSSSNSSPRFAVVLVEYDDLSKNHLIFLRQGEAPATVSGYYMFATYNISSTESSTSGIYEFVDYPSIGGGKKQWSSDATVYASSSSSSTTSVDTDTIANICPSGYEIPSYSAFYYAAENGNYIGGMIADGYYDRLLLTSVTLNGVGPYYIGGSSTTTAYSGGLFYNINTYASVFFPYAGYLPVGSSASLTGQRGYYWGTNEDSSYGISLSMQFENSDTIPRQISLSPGQWNSKYYGFSIRPITSE